jgi:hypothetical protein
MASSSSVKFSGKLVRVLSLFLTLAVVNGLLLWYINRDSLCYYRQAEIYDLLTTGGCCWELREITGIKPWLPGGHWNPEYVETFTIPICPETKQQFIGTYNAYSDIHCPYHGNLVNQYGIHYIPGIDKRYSYNYYLFTSIFYPSKTIIKTKLFRILIANLFGITVWLMMILSYGKIALHGKWFRKKALL